jgi:hypothetical protein
LEAGTGEYAKTEQFYSAVGLRIDK